MRTKGSGQSLEGLILLLVIVFFSRGLLQTFDLAKTLVLAFSCPLLLSLAYIKRRQIDPKMVQLLAFFSVAFLATSASGISPYRSMVGSDFRFTGAILLLPLTLFALLWSAPAVADSVSRIRLALVSSSIPVVFYALIQRFGEDPFEWKITSFGGAPFSTLGNPNTLAAFLAVAVVLVFHSSITSTRVWVKMASSSYFALVAFVGVLSDSFQFFSCAFGLLYLLGKHSLRKSSNSGVVIKLDLHSFLLFCLIPLLAFSQGSISLVAVLSLPVCALSAAYMPREFSFRTSINRKTVISLVVAGSLVLASVLVATSDFIRTGFVSGYKERGAFFESAFRGFLERPLMGWGPETFGYKFAQWRPSWHANELGGSLTNSTHNVFLGYLYGGGLVLLTAFLLLLAGALRRVLRADSEDQSVIILMALLIVQIPILFVSVEAVSVLAIFFATVGSCFACKSQAKRSIGLKRPTRLPIIVSGHSFPLVTLALFSVTSLFVSIRLLVTEERYEAGLDALYLSGDAELSTQILRDVVSLAPSDPRYLIDYANALYSAGAVKESLETYDRAMEILRFPSSSAPEIARLHLANGDYLQALYIISQAAENDPSNLRLRSLRDELVALEG